jgi:hypothetical protein
MNASFEKGKAREFIDSIENFESRYIALSEYYYFTGQVEKACETVEKYIAGCEGVVNASAWIVYGFSCLTLGKTRLAKVVTESVAEMVNSAINADVPDSVKATCVFLHKTSRVIITGENMVVPLKKYIRYLTGGFRAFSCFNLAQEACFKGQFGRASGIAEMGIALMEEDYPLARIHLELVSAMAHLGLKEVSKASEHLLNAWEIAQKDGFYQPFVEDFSSLQMLMQTCIEDNYPEQFAKISAAATVYSSSRRRLSRRDDYDDISKPLDSDELVTAIMLKSDASNADIAHALDTTVSEVKEMIPPLLKKLGVNNKKELYKFFDR